MENIKEQEKNIKIYIEFLKKVKENPNYIPNLEESEVFNKIVHDSSYNQILNKINGASDYNSQIGILSDYISEQILKDTKDEKELISQITGVDVKDIEELELTDKSKIFAFYDDKLGRKRIIENLGTDSLNAQLKDAINNSIDYQTDNFQKNTENIMKDRALDNSNRQEFNLVDIGELLSNPRDNIRNIKDNTNSILHQLSALKDEHEIKYVDMDRMVALDAKNNVIELTQDENGILNFNTPTKWQSKVDEISNEDKLNDEILTDENSLANENSSNTDSDENTLEPNDLEDNPNLITAEEIETELKLSGLEARINNPDEVMKNIVNYYNNPEEMERIEDPIERAFYDKMVNEIYAERFNKKQKENNNARNLTYTNPELKNAGFVDIILMSILIIILGFMVVAILFS